MPDSQRIAGEAVVVESDDMSALSAGVDAAISYRGDVTILRRSTGEAVEGYAYDRKPAGKHGPAAIRLIPKDGSRVTIPIEDIARIEFTGRDTASGKSFETWMKKYVEKKLAGERAAIESEATED